MVFSSRQRALWVTHTLEIPNVNTNNCKNKSEEGCLRARRSAHRTAGHDARRTLSRFAIAGPAAGPYLHSSPTFAALPWRSPAKFSGDVNNRKDDFEPGFHFSSAAALEVGRRARLHQTRRGLRHPAPSHEPGFPLSCRRAAVRNAFITRTSAPCRGAHVPTCALLTAPSPPHRRAAAPGPGSALQPPPRSVPGTSPTASSPPARSPRRWCRRAVPAATATPSGSAPPARPGRGEGGGARGAAPRSCRAAAALVFGSPRCPRGVPAQRRGGRRVARQLYLVWAGQVVERSVRPGKGGLVRSQSLDVVLRCSPELRLFFKVVVEA